MKSDSISERSSWRSSYDALVKIVGSRDLDDYYQTIARLHQAQQSLIAEIIDEGGAIVRIHVNLDEDGENVTETEKDIETRVEHLINDSSINRSNRMLVYSRLKHEAISDDRPKLGLGQSKVIAAKTGKSIVLYIFCKTTKDLGQLMWSLTIDVELLKDYVKSWFSFVKDRLQRMLMTALTVSGEDWNKRKSYFVEGRFSEQYFTSGSGILSPTSEDWPNDLFDSVFAGGVEVIAIQDFDPQRMKYDEIIELQDLLKKHQPTTFTSEYFDLQLNPYAEAILFEKGDKMATIRPETTRDIVGWWRVKHYKSGQIGFIPRNRVILTCDESISETKMNDLPLEMLDIMLAKLVMYWMVHSSLHQRDEDVFNNIALVDFCWFQRIRKRRFKTKILQRLKDMNASIRVLSAVISMNRNYLLENIEPTDDLIASLLSVNCITKEQRDTIQRRRSKQDKNAELLYFLSAFDDTLSSNFTRTIRDNNRQTRARAFKIGDDLGAEIQERRTIFSKNRNELLEGIQPSDWPLDGTSEEQNQFIQGHTRPTEQEENTNFLHFSRSLYDRPTLSSNFIRCLRRNNQQTVARIIENGGVVLEVEVQYCSPEDTAFVRDVREKLYSKIQDLRNKDKERSHQTDERISQLKEEGIEIVSSYLVKQAIVVWFWCRSQKAFDNIKRHYELNLLASVLFGLADIRPCTPELTKSTMVNMDSNQFRKRDVESSVFANFPRITDTGRVLDVHGVSKLRNEIYIITRSVSCSVIHVFHRRTQYPSREPIVLEEIKFPVDMVSSEKENCLYIFEGWNQCIWKIERGINDQFTIAKWLTTDYKPMALSVSYDGQLLVVKVPSSTLMVYGSEAELITSIQLQNDIVNPRHAVETSIGNFIILHQCVQEDRRLMGSRGNTLGLRWVVSEVTRDGQMVIRRFSPSNDSQELNAPEYILLDSDDRVFVADTRNDRVVFFNSNLKWNRILCQSRVFEEKQEGHRIPRPWKLCYDEDNKEVFVGCDKYSEDNDRQSPNIMFLHLKLFQTALLDIILEKSILHWIRVSQSHQRDVDAVKCLVSVEHLWFIRLKDFYGKTQKMYGIIRNNRQYFLQNIDPNDMFIALLMSLKCITEQQTLVILRQRSNRDKNLELLNFLSNFNHTMTSNFVRCLRQTNQTAVARVLENGGVVVKVEVANRAASCTKSFVSPLFCQNINDLRSRTQPRSHLRDKFINLLKDEGIEILSSQMNQQIAVVWTWFPSQEALESIQQLRVRKLLKGILFSVANMQQGASETIKDHEFTTDGDQFLKTAVVRKHPIKIHAISDVARNNVRGATKLRNEIYVLCSSFSSPVIYVFEDQSPFSYQRNIEIRDIKFAFDIGSSEKDNCIYVSDTCENCIWKIARETDGQHKITKWLTTDYKLTTLTVNSDGQLLMVKVPSSILMIYKSDAELLHSIQLSSDINLPRHAVETSTGNFIILHQSVKEEDKREIGSRERNPLMHWVISEVTRDGQMVIRRFIPSDETQTLKYPNYLSLDSDDRVFVADKMDGRVILLKSNLKWNKLIFPTKEEKDDYAHRFARPRILCYDEEYKQLIVGGNLCLREERMLHAVRDFDPKQMKDSEATELEHILKAQRSDSNENYSSEDKVDPFAEAIPFEREDKMITISPTNIGDSVGWWKVKHFKSRKMGFIPRNCVVIESGQQPLDTTLNVVPMELLDIILEHSLLRCILNSSPQHTWEGALRSLASVDVCWFQRITSCRFKKRICTRLKDRSLQ